jgi:MoxR-like ATPase
MHARWITGVLGPGDSLFTPGTAVWTAEHLDELGRDFIGQPDLTKGKNFLDKLHDQLAHVSAGAVQLMSELHAVHFLIISNSAISALKKRRDLEAIVSWMPVPCTVPDDVLAVMAPGLVHPGQWVMTRRDTQLAWLIRFSRAWKDLPETRQHELIADPWALKAFSETIQSESSDSARLALLHLAHPDTFEAIVSPGHRQLITMRFAEAGGTDPGLDRRLLAIRATLEREYGERFDWYADPLFRRWFKAKAWSAFMGWLRLFRDTPAFGQVCGDVKDLAAELREVRGLVLAAADDWVAALDRAFTGRANGAAASVSGLESFLSWLASDPEAGHAALVALWEGPADPACRITSFLELVPATLIASPAERLDLGAFLLSGDSTVSVPPLVVSNSRIAWDLAGWGRDADGLDPVRIYRRELVFLDEIVHDSAGWESPIGHRLDAYAALSALLTATERPGGWPDDRWQAYTAFRNLAPPEDDPTDRPTSDDETTADDTDAVQLTDYIATAAQDLHVDRAVLDEIVDLLEDKRQVILYGPPGTGKTFLALRLARAITEGDEARVSIVQLHPATSYEDFFEGLRPQVTSAGQVTYERTDGPLAAIAAQAAADKDRQHVMVIDEINRANLPKVLGELLFLLEYRTESARTLYRPQQPFSLPGNLWFIATMNTADRSVALIDAAMRRRFHFVPFFPHDGPMKELLRRWLAAGGGRAGVADLLDAVNNELLGLVGEHLLIGPSHFMKTDLSDRGLDRIWTYNVFPLIEEQLWGNQEEIDRWRWASVKARFASALTGSSPPPSPGRTVPGEANDEPKPS